MMQDARFTFENIIRTYLKIGFLCFFVIPGLIRNPVTLPFYYIKTKNYEFSTLKSLDTGWSLPRTRYGAGMT